MNKSEFGFKEKVVQKFNFKGENASLSGPTKVGPGSEVPRNIPIVLDKSETKNLPKENLKEKQQTPFEKLTVNCRYCSSKFEGTFSYNNEKVTTEIIEQIESLAKTECKNRGWSEKITTPISGFTSGNYSTKSLCPECKKKQEVRIDWK